MALRFVRVVVLMVMLLGATKPQVALTAFKFPGSSTPGPIPSASPLASPSRELYAVVPFGEPDEDDAQYTYATQELVQLLSDVRVRSAMVPPIDPFEAMSDSTSICRQVGGGGILIGTLTHTETRDSLSVSMIPTLGLADATGAFDGWHVHAQLHLRLVSCAGKVLWSTTAGGNATHRGANVAASASIAVRAALSNAVQQLATHIEKDLS
ncbi:MAG TPA: hypothetical protein VGZ00_12200 [Candidatus Baltobacteraceae bacterium]|jgi:hypothetical protein|nr:hypothetical protein [Candidatus Baltobacteraceae bacterium]